MDKNLFETNNQNTTLGYGSLEETCSNIEHLRGTYDKAVVILCGGITEGYANTWRSNYMTRMRMIAGAMDYFNSEVEMKSPVMIVSGGVIDTQKIGIDLSTSAIMAYELIELGVPYQNIILEQFSLDTSQNAQNTSKILNTLGFNEEGSVMLITNKFHLKRAEKSFRRIFQGNLESMSAEDIMIYFGEGKLPGHRYNRRYGQFAERYLKSYTNKKETIKHKIIEKIFDLPWGQDFLTWLALVSRSSNR